MPDNLHLRESLKLWLEGVTVAYPGSSELLWRGRGSRSTQTEPSAFWGWVPGSLLTRKGRAADHPKQKHLALPQNMNHLQATWCTFTVSLTGPEHFQLTANTAPKAAELSPAVLCPHACGVCPDGVSSCGFPKVGHLLLSHSSAFCASTRPLLLKLFPSQMHSEHLFSIWQLQWSTKC